MGWPGERVAFLHGCVMVHVSRLPLSSQTVAHSASTHWTGLHFDSVVCCCCCFLKGAHVKTWSYCSPQWIFWALWMFYSWYSAGVSWWVRNKQSFACACVYVSSDVWRSSAAAAISVNGLKPFTSSREYTPANCVPATPRDRCENGSSEKRCFQQYNALG